MMAIARPHPQARRIVPEVVQTSMMDCGPASLLALMQGFGISVSYGRLREACQTSVDGTSISTMDEVANLLGLQTDEIMIPADHLLRPEARALPAIVVIRHANNITHFVLVWSIMGPWVQVMDPAQGRRWMSRQALLDQLYIHTLEVPAATWRAWASSQEFQDALDARLAEAGAGKEARAGLRREALEVPGWRGVAALDAATRMVSAMVRAGAFRAGDEALALIGRLAAEARHPGAESLIPRIYWSVIADEGGDHEPDTLAMRGAVLVRARGRADEPPELGALPRELSAALSEKPTSPGRTLLHMLVQDDLITPLGLTAAVVGAAMLVLFEAVLLRGFLELGDQLGLMSQRAAAAVALVVLLALGLALELPLIRSALALGRMLELRLRIAFLDKIPRLTDRYFHSRLLSDMAERGHSLHLIRGLPLLGLGFLRGGAQLIFTVAGIAWLAPSSAPLALLAAAMSIGLPLLFQPLMAERDLKLRHHAGALSRFYLDALLGLIPIRVHGAQQAVQREQEGLLVQWSQAGFLLQSTATWVEGVLAMSGFGLAVLMVFSVAGEGDSGTLLLVYWALSIPVLGQQVAIVTRQYPMLRNVVSRMLEPLGAPEEPDAPDSGAEPVSTGALAIRMQEVSVEAGGHTILEAVDLSIEPGSHVAIVGPSGAGKSSFVGLLLGWHQPARGRVEIDGRALTGSWLRHVRQRTAWVDPGVQLWNRSFLDNLLYGAGDELDPPIAQALDKARLRELIEHLPEGLQTRLGEGGSLVSGGEGQRVRLGRGLIRRDAGLVILDEPFRGLDGQTRRELLAESRAWWRHATLLWVTHDLAETRGFDRVLVVEGGRVVEDGAPGELLARPGSHYEQMLACHESMRQTLWSGTEWRRLWLDGGTLREEEPR
jgi:ABC-type bacteriocin/lantibiotic exporter with double-glycine peptidase domain